MRRFNKKRVGKQGLLWKQLLGQPWGPEEVPQGEACPAWGAVPKGFSL